MKRMRLFCTALLIFFCFFRSMYAEEKSYDYEKIVDAIADSHIGKNVPGACVLISEKGETVFSKCYGFADLENKREMSAESTVFEWGSVTKTLVWVSILQLEEKGRLDLHEDVRKYLPQGFLKNLKYEKKITLLDLMNHTAGFEEALIDFRYMDEEKEKSLSEVLSEHQPRQVFEPGQISAYSNWGAALAALIVENVSGQSFDEYVQENIWERLSVQNAEIRPFLSGNLREQKAKGYSHTSKGFREEDPMRIRMYPAGALNTSPNQLMKYVSELAKGKERESLLFDSSAAKDRLFSKTWLSFGASSGLAHGFWEYAGSRGVYGHEGGTYGFKTQIWVEPRRERAVIIASNVMETSFCSEVIGAITERSLPKTLGDAGATEFEVLEGDYVPARAVWTNPGKIYGMMQTIHISRSEDGERIILRKSAEGSEFSFVPIEKNRFYCSQAPPEEQYLAFRTEKGRVVSMTFRLAHDYLPAKGGQSLRDLLIFAAISVASWIFWLILFMRLMQLKKRKRECFFTLKLLCISFGLAAGLSCAVFVLKWFRIYTILSSQLNAAVLVNYISVAFILGSSIYLFSKKQGSFAAAALIAGALQFFAAAGIGFFCIV